ncbi:MAG TPA: hypothetical protein VLA76_03200 [Candidatus Angelobacter sp.]|nr:hypothetical protein [Candidatus Angelobacter sp.]
MITAALIAFGALALAWLVAPGEAQAESAPLTTATESVPERA